MATQKLSDCVRFVEHNQMNDDITFYKICLQNKLSHKTYPFKGFSFNDQIKNKVSLFTNHKRNLHSKRNSMIGNKLTNNY